MCGMTSSIISLQVNQRQMHKYEQESKKQGKASFAYAWVLDETGEERQRSVGSQHIQ